MDVVQTVKSKLPKFKLTKRDAGSVAVGAVVGALAAVGTYFGVKKVQEWRKKKAEATV